MIIVIIANTLTTIASHDWIRFLYSVHFDIIFPLDKDGIEIPLEIVGRERVLREGEDSLFCLGGLDTAWLFLFFSCC